MYFMLKSIYVSIQLQEHGRVHVCNVTIGHASCVILKFINQSLHYVMVIVYFFLHAHADEPPVVSLTVKIRDGFLAVWTVPTSAVGKVQRFKVVLFQVKPRHRVKRFLLQPNVRGKYFSSLKPGHTYEVRVRMKLIGNRSFGSHGNLTVTL